MNLKDKVIVVTGGAQGLGLEMATMCAEAGANLALIDMNTEQLGRAQEQLAIAWRHCAHLSGERC